MDWLAFYNVSFAIVPFCCIDDFPFSFQVIYAAASTSGVGGRERTGTRAGEDRLRRGFMFRAGDERKGRDRFGCRCRFGAARTKTGSGASLGSRSEGTEGGGCWKDWDSVALEIRLEGSIANMKFLREAFFACGLGSVF